MKIVDQQYEPTPDDVRYALIRILTSKLTKDQKCSCSFVGLGSVRCVLCLAMMSIGIEVWHENDYRREQELKGPLADARLKSGLWHRQMAALVHSLHYSRGGHDSLKEVLWAAGELDMPAYVYELDTRNWPRILIEDAGGPGQLDRHGSVLAPPGWRQETDDEIRARVQLLHDEAMKRQDARLRAEHPESFTDLPG